MSVADSIIVSCRHCGAVPKKQPPMKKRGGPRCPKQWKIEGDGFRCPKCSAEKMIVRSVRLRILKVLPEKGRTWRELQTALFDASRECRELANWYAQRLWRTDPAFGDDAVLARREGQRLWREATSLSDDDPAKTKLLAAAKKAQRMESMPTLDVYGEARKLFPNVAPKSICLLTKMVRGWYVKDRLGVIQGKRSVRNFREDDLPIPVQNQSVSLFKERDEGGEYWVARLAVSPGGSYYVRVAVDPYNRRYMDDLFAGDAEPGAATIVRRRRQPRPGEDPSMVPKCWYLRISGTFRKPERRVNATNALRLETGETSMWHGVVDGEPGAVFSLPGAELKQRVQAAVATRRDMQTESSMLRGHRSRRTNRRRVKENQHLAARRQRAIGDLMHQAISRLCDWSVRHRVGEITYDSSLRSWCPELPWARLQMMLANKLENEGITFRVAIAPKERDA